MSNEKADEFLSWRGRLSSPDALPEQGLDDKELSWQRLAERLERKPARRGAAWWIAAACLLMALLPATRFFRAGPAPVSARTHTRLPTAPAPRTATPLPAAALSPKRPAGEPAIRRPGPTHISNSNYGEFAAIKTPKVFHTLSASDSPAFSVVSAVPSVTSPTPSVTSPIPPIASASPSVNLPPTTAKPRPTHALRIVYLNELEDKNGPAPSLALRQPAFLRLGIASTGAGSQAADQTPNPLIKINIASPNH
jgi:hypothetical protein